MHIDKEALTSPLAIGGSTFVTLGVVDLIAGGGPAGIVFGALPVAYVIAKYGKSAVEALIAQDAERTSQEQEDETERFSDALSHTEQMVPAKRTMFQRIMGIYPEGSEGREVDSENNNETLLDGNSSDDDDDFDLLPPGNRSFVFSRVLDTFRPSLHAIYLGSLPDGTPLYCRAKDLCHVALAGVTGGGKTSIIRLLMSQLCASGASVLLLNPHYTNFDVDADEDWTPFLPYLVHDPMACRKYDVIEHYLKQVATVLLPKRLEKYARSERIGKPYFIVLDELPAIIAHVEQAPKYLADILREGRKVGIYFITAAQDFLVKTIAPQGGGAIRECYRTTYYVGGDPTTAKVLLDMPANQIPEDELGKGSVMLRNLSVKRATRAFVPYVDNQALYQLLGPSTYVPSSSAYERMEQEDDLFLEQLPSCSPPPLPSRIAPTQRDPIHPTVLPTPRPMTCPTHTTVSYGYGAFGNRSVAPSVPPMAPMAPNPLHSTPGADEEWRQFEDEALREEEQTPMRSVSRRHEPSQYRTSAALPPNLQRTLDAYRPGMSLRELGNALGVSKDTANKWLAQLKAMRLVV